MKGFIHLHIPKNGGKSVEQYFFGTPQVNAHRRSLALLPSLDDFKDWYVFAFIRDPFDRVVSIYKYYKGGGNQSPFDITIGGWVSRLTLSEFVSRLPSNLEGCPYHDQIETMIIPQVSYIRDGVNLHCFDNFEEEIHKIARRIGFPVRKIPHINKSSSTAARLCDKDESIIVDLYKKDLDLYKKLRDE